MLRYKLLVSFSLYNGDKRFLCLGQQPFKFSTLFRMLHVWGCSKYILICSLRRDSDQLISGLAHFFLCCGDKLNPDHYQPSVFIAAPPTFPIWIEQPQFILEIHIKIIIVLKPNRQNFKVKLKKLIVNKIKICVSGAICRSEDLWTDITFKLFKTDCSLPLMTGVPRINSWFGSQRLVYFQPAQRTLFILNTHI